MSQDENNSNKEYLGEGGTHEVVFSNDGGKVKIEPVLPGNTDVTKSIAAQLGETLPGIVMPPPPERDDSEEPTDPRIPKQGEDEETAPPADTPTPFRISVPGLKKTVEGE